MGGVGRGLFCAYRFAGLPIPSHLQGHHAVLARGMIPAELPGKYSTRHSLMQGESKRNVLRKKVQAETVLELVGGRDGAPGP